MDSASIFIIAILIVMLSCPGMNANPISLDFGNNITVLVDLGKPHGMISEWNMTNNTTPRLNTTTPNFTLGNDFVFGNMSLEKPIWNKDSPKMPPVSPPLTFHFPLSPLPPHPALQRSLNGYSARPWSPTGHK
jgi:hypothetical protein